MTRRKKIISFAALVLALCVALAVLAALQWAHAPPDPEYHGKKLSAWLKEDKTQTVVLFIDDEFLPLAPETHEAIRAMGTNALPFLWQEFNATDSPARTRLIALLRRQPIRTLDLAPDYTRHTRAYRALYFLRHQAAPLAPELARSLGTPERGGDAQSVLQNIGPAALPALREALRAPEPWARFRAASLTARLDTRATNHFPALVESIRQTNDLPLRRQAIETLDYIYTRGHEPLYRALLECTQNSDAAFAREAADAIVRCSWKDPDIETALSAIAAQTNDLALAKAASNTLNHAAFRKRP